SCGVRRFF
ncbi:hypothetical protein D030_2412B, partial [Vibrio parahaemolyticus AQ3810]